jgi:hypothetical protein
MTRPHSLPVFNVMSARARVDVKVYVFYADLLYKSYPFLMHQDLLELPDGCYLYTPVLPDRQWFRKDLTPILFEDVPPTLKMLALILGK